MDKSSSLENLMSQRSRPKVPKRPDIITKKSQDVIIDNSQDVKTSLSQDTKKSMSNNQETQKSQLFEDIVTVRSTTRLEASIDKKLRHLCTDEKLTKETWIEAAFLYLSAHPDEMTQVNEIAQQRLRNRKELADLKRAMAMKERLEQRLS